MKLVDKVNKLEKEVQELKTLVRCSQGRHNFRFLDLNESFIERDYYIRHVCKDCGKIIQRSPNDHEINLLLIETKS